MVDLVPSYSKMGDDYLTGLDSDDLYPDHCNQGAKERSNMEPLKIEVPTRMTNKGRCKLPPCWGWVLIVIGIGILVVLLVSSVVHFTSVTPSTTPLIQATTDLGPLVKASSVTPSPTPLIQATTDLGPLVKASSVFVDCKGAYDNGNHTSGVYRISPDGDVQMEVYCEQQRYDGGWTVIQGRQYGNVSFYRNWADYKSGFGDLTGDFWLGNDYIHILTAGRYQKLKIEMTHPNGTLAIADYLHFWSENETMKYQLRVSGFSHTVPPGEAFGHHNGQYFTTFDNDNDKSDDGNCADISHGGWWYRKCSWANLNGVYGAASNTGINWYKFTNYNKSLTSVRMMVKT